jgi:hypothetical protein
VSAEGGENVPAEPQHCGLQEQTCHGTSAVSTKQRNLIRLYSRLTRQAEPNYDDMTRIEAAGWLTNLWDLWVADGGPSL